MILTKFLEIVAYSEAYETAKQEFLRKTLHLICLTEF